MTDKRTIWNALDEETKAFVRELAKEFPIQQIKTKGLVYERNEHKRSESNLRTDKSKEAESRAVSGKDRPGNQGNARTDYQARRR